MVFRWHILRRPQDHLRVDMLLRDFFGEDEIGEDAIAFSAGDHREITFSPIPRPGAALVEIVDLELWTVEMQVDLGTEGVDGHFPVPGPGSEFMDAGVGIQLIAFDTSTAGVIADEDELACMGNVGEPELLSGEKPIWVVSQV